MEIYPSLISSDLLNLQKTISLLDPHCSGYHLDVMDDHFVPNLTWGPAFINAIIKTTSKPVHVHVMVQDPASWVDRIAYRPTDLMVFHIESFKNPTDVHQLITILESKKIARGIAINPTTPVQAVFDFLPKLQQVLLMSVNPGFSGQKFIESTLEKLKPLVDKQQSYNHSFSICMDGGINEQNIKAVAAHGVNQVGVASALFEHNDPIEALRLLRSNLA